MNSPQPASTRPNLLTPPPAGAPAFTGDQRTKARALLASKISDRQVMAVLQLVNKDPSLALDTVPMASAAGGLARTDDIDFPVACLQHDVLPGLVFASAVGYDPNKLTPTGLSLLDLAVARTNLGSAEGTVGLLLGMGANPNSTRPLDDVFGGTFSAAMTMAYPAGKGQQYPGVISMLLDAKANPVYPQSHKCPASILVSTGGWDDPRQAAELTKMMARLVKAGVLLDRPSGHMKLLPVQLALGQKNGNALVALVRLGASVSSATLRGKELSELMKQNGLEEFIPAVRAASMERVIVQATAKHAAEAGPAAAAPAEPRRRRMGAL